MRAITQRLTPGLRKSMTRLGLRIRLTAYRIAYRLTSLTLGADGQITGTVNPSALGPRVNQLPLPQIGEMLLAIMARAEERVVQQILRDPARAARLQQARTDFAAGTATQQQLEALTPFERQMMFTGNAPPRNRRVSLPHGRTGVLMGTFMVNAGARSRYEAMRQAMFRRGWEKVGRGELAELGISEAEAARALRNPASLASARARYAADVDTRPLSPSRKRAVGNRFGTLERALQAHSIISQSLEGSHLPGIGTAQRLGTALSERELMTLNQFMGRGGPMAFQGSANPDATGLAVIRRRVGQMLRRLARRVRGPQRLVINGYDLHDLAQAVEGFLASHIHSPEHPAFEERLRAELEAFLVAYDG